MLNKISILHIEDDLTFAKMVESYLDSISDFTSFVTSASSLAEAHLNLKQKDFDIVLIDLHLSDSAGINTFYNIKTNFPSIPLVIMTSIDEHALAIEAVKSGAQDYIEKDELSPRILRKTISYSIERFRLQRELEKANLDLKHKSKQLNVSNKSLEVFAKILTRDISLPIAALVSYSEQLNSNYKEKVDSLGATLIRNIWTSSSRLEELINEMSTHANRSNISYNSSYVNNSSSKKRVSLSRSLEDAVAYCLPELEECDGAVTSNKLGEIYGNSQSITNLFQNLIFFSINNLSEKKKLRVAVETVDDPEELISSTSFKEKIKDGFQIISVRSNGKQFSESEVLNFFETSDESKQKNSSDNKKSSKNIKQENLLPPSQVIVNKHGGDIYCEPSLEDGYTFYFTLPSASVVAKPNY